MRNNNIDFELDAFIQNLYHEVQSLVYADENGDSKENKFTEYVMETLAEAGETEGIRLCTYIKENKNENIQFKINGYALEEGYENIDIFISSYKDTNQSYRLAKSDFDKSRGRTYNKAKVKESQRLIKNFGGVIYVRISTVQQKGK